MRRNIDYALMEVIVSDFVSILGVLVNDHTILNSKNLSRYDYYIIRIITRNGLPIDTGLFKDLIDSAAKEKYDNRLFGVVFPSLGWDKNCVCLHFNRWRKGHMWDSVKWEKVTSYLRLSKTSRQATVESKPVDYVEK